MNNSNRPEVVAITGASAGVGRAAVREFAKHGAHIGLLARGTDGLEAARAEVEKAGGQALVLPTDVADAAGVERAAEVLERKFGPIDIWVNNAMTTVFAPFLEISAEEYRRATEVTYLGFVNGTRAALKRMKPRDRGVIVQVGSALAYRAIPLQSPYCGAKHAIRGFTDSIRTELIHDGSKVHITMVHLPALNTPQFDWCLARVKNHPQPVPPISQPEVAAEAIYWAAHNRRREMRVGWPTVMAIVGNKLAPGFADWYLGKTGYESQQTDYPFDPNRPVNLWSAVRGDHGAHGRFDDRASSRSVQLWLTTNRTALGLIGAGLAGLGVAIWAASARKPASRTEAVRRSATRSSSGPSGFGAAISPNY